MTFGFIYNTKRFSVFQRVTDRYEVDPTLILQQKH